jgi:hypothetical protein
VADHDQEDQFDGLERWAAEARAREAADARVRERWLRTQAEEDARLVQVLTGLAERRTEAIATTTSGYQVTGRVAAVGQDFLAMSGSLGRTTLVPFSALAWVRPVAVGRRPAVAFGPHPADPGWPDDLAAGDAASLADVLSHAAASRPRVSLHALGASLAGELRAVGVDVLVIETSGEPAALAYVRLTRSRTSPS